MPAVRGGSARGYRQRLDRDTHAISRTLGLMVGMCGSRMWIRWIEWEREREGLCPHDARKRIAPKAGSCSASMARIAAVVLATGHACIETVQHAYPHSGLYHSQPSQPIKTCTQTGRLSNDRWCQERCVNKSQQAVDILLIGLACTKRVNASSSKL